MNIKANWLLRRPRIKNSKAAALLAVALVLILTTTAFAATLLSIAGYLDFGYPVTVPQMEPTEGRPEHKLWYHDGMWWASMYSTQAGSYAIHRLDWSTQTWVNTGVLLDEREDSRSDTLWDGTKLYIATYAKQENPSPVNNSDNWARLYRYSYDNAADTYTLDSGFPYAELTHDKTKVLSLEKDSEGRLWIAYISRPTGSSLEYQLYVRSTIDSDTNWNIPMAMATIFPNEALTASHDVVGLVAFEDNSGPKLGIMWSNERADVNKFFFAVHPDGSAYNAGWVMDGDAIPYSANDHINLAKTSTGQVFAAVKTSTTTPGGALNAVIARDSDGSYSFHAVNPLESNDTKPIVAVYEPNSGPDKVYVFMSSNPTGGEVCSVEAIITADLSDMVFPVRNCGSPGFDRATLELADASTYTLINNPTTTRQILNETTDIVVLATDQANNVYVHAVVINPPDVPVTPTSTFMFLPVVRK